jgi:hypothetical protein
MRLPSSSAHDGRSALLRAVTAPSYVVPTNRPTCVGTRCE